jgi:hypothetical protein
LLLSKIAVAAWHGQFSEQRWPRENSWAQRSSSSVRSSCASVLAWKGSNIAWKILAILFNVCPLAAGLLAVLSGMSTSTMVNTAVGAGLISWGIAWVFAGVSLSTRPRLVLAR